MLQGYRSYEHWTLLPWTAESEQILAGLRAQRIRVGTMDLRIASIALSLGATVLTRNLADFQQVPGLLAENWLEFN